MIYLYDENRVFTGTFFGSEHYARVYCSDEELKNSTSVEIPDGLCKPKFDTISKSWTESATEEELAEAYKPLSEESVKKLEEDKQKLAFVSEYELKEQVSKVATELSVAMAEMINGILGG